jgi:hypothetical protein
MFAAEIIEIHQTEELIQGFLATPWERVSARDKLRNLLEDPAADCNGSGGG